MANRACQIVFDAFDTANSVTLYGVDAEVGEALAAQCRDYCLRLHQLWDFSQPQSDIARINYAGIGRIDVAPETCQVIAAGFDVTSAEPAFDMTVGPVTSLWKHASCVPEPDAIAEALTHTGAANFKVGEGFIEKLDEAARVDVGAIAKGFAADALRDLLTEAGVKSADIDLGGNLYMMGEHPEGRPWRLEIDLGDKPPCAKPRLLLIDASASTSNNLQRAELIDGVEYGHIIDPSTGMPASTDLLSVTVIATSSLEADALSTVALAVGSEGLPQLANRHPHQGFIAVTRGGEVLVFNLPNKQAMPLQN